MAFLNHIYKQRLEESKKNLSFYEDYLARLKSLDFSIYFEKLKVPILVPVGTRLHFRGELKHTNEITVALGCSYFVKCSVAQAEILRQHRIKVAQENVDLYKKEYEYLENQMFLKQNLLEEDCQEIIEEFNEEEDNAWREKHRKNVRKYMQEKAKKRQEETPEYKITDEELWEKLELLELKEEMENELLDSDKGIADERTAKPFLQNEEKLILKKYRDDKQNEHYLAKIDVDEPKYKSTENTNHQPFYGLENIQSTSNEEPILPQRDIKLNEKHFEPGMPQIEKTKLELLQHVLDKQNKLESKLHELKYKNREPSKTEQDLITKLNEMEQLDEIEDEIERLDDILETEETDSEDSAQSDALKLKRSISFADEDECQTVAITFKHSDVEPDSTSYDPEKGISKPSDVYEAYSHLFDSKTTSILKKSKYGSDVVKELAQTGKTNKKVNFEETVTSHEPEEFVSPEETTVDRTIVINDIVEKTADCPKKRFTNPKKIEMGARPTSLFKKKRMQNNS